MMNQPLREGELVPIQEQRVDLEAMYTQQEMAARLGDMRAKLSIVQSFFKDVMVKDQDYGIIPGMDKPTLFKAGAEKLCELYGFAITIKDLQETTDQATGYYRAIVTVALIHRRSGVVVAEGVGEANTNEGRYRWRWVPEFKLPKGIDATNLICEERKAKSGKAFKMYRIENDDPWTLWNTVLKMAKKRALIDATLSATRSSGLFTQDIEDLEEWAGAGVDYPVEVKAKAAGSKKTEGAGDTSSQPGRGQANGNGNKAQQSGSKRTPEQQERIDALNGLMAKIRSLDYPGSDIRDMLLHRYNKELVRQLTTDEARDFNEFIDRLEDGTETWPPTLNLTDEDLAHIDSMLKQSGDDGGYGHPAPDPVEDPETGQIAMPWD